jgi:transposase
VVEELGRAGVSAHVAEPAETAALKGKKRRAKTDRSDTRHLRSLLVEGRIPESWIPPADVLDVRVQVRLYTDLLEERTSWFQRVQATLYHHGVPHLASRLVTEAGRRHLAEAARLAVEMGMRQIERLSAEMLPLRKQIAVLANHQPGCKALQTHHCGVGPLTSAAIWSEMGDCRRFSSSDDAVRHTGLDVTVYSSDGKKTRGHLAKQGPPALRWALYEAAVYTGRPSSPDHAYFSSVKKRLDGQLALLSVARKLARRCYHTLRNLGDAAFPAVAAEPPNLDPTLAVHRRDDLRPAPSNPVAARRTWTADQERAAAHFPGATPRHTISSPTPCHDAEHPDKPGRFTGRIRN